jgi:chemotaxis protein MotB
MAKKEEDSGGAPAWLLTYGDMITLVLCFFVLLFTMSEIKKDKVTRTMRAFQAQFGVLPKYKASVQVFIEARRMTQTEANVLRQGPRGSHPNVQTLYEGNKTKTIIGGKTLFREGAYILTEEGRQLIMNQVAPDLKGYENKVEIRGHTASAAYGAGRGFQDAWDLSFRRAYAVMRLLVDECGIDERRLRVVACGDSEPRDTNLTPEGRERNRRVEIIMTEEFVSDRDVQLQP